MLLFESFGDKAANPLYRNSLQFGLLLYIWTFVNKLKNLVSSFSAFKDISFGLSFLPFSFTVRRCSDNASISVSSPGAFPHRCIQKLIVDGPGACILVLVPWLCHPG